MDSKEEKTTICVLIVATCLTVTACVVSYNWRIATVERAHVEAGEELTPVVGNMEPQWRKR